MDTQEFQMLLQEKTTAVEQILQEHSVVFRRFFFHKFYGNPHTAVALITAITQNGVDFRLFHRKSEGHGFHALRFVDVCDLFGFGGDGYVIKKIQLLSAGQL